ncbi:exonuclease SbcC [Pseudomonas asturiensis]|uniref:Exonuclease SbcC n=1 Tax=Pseudomonas asturiensis TaxID=1190415 RepID=A0A1M7KJJ5_9PSED|nr:AAA family ATPase [Pseudomonas asturiensis]SHM65299.1 exonuclease SbcC [Pseudomonas asturiensis]
MKIKKVEIEAFRAYKMKSEGTFDFTNADDLPSNFVAIFAPNGFGKSSFYDAVEWAVTNHLERLGGDYNRANYEGAARATKDVDKGQEILRNKYVDDDVKTQVVVSTTLPTPFTRELGKIRINGRDLRFGEKGRENDYFRRVILSQDEIDRFLREAKPQERYTKFMENFGGKTEKARKELTALILDNKSELLALDSQREAIIAELDQPVDLSIFDSFNAIATQLNAAGENILLADERFSAQAEYALNASLISRQHELNVEREANVRAVDTLADRLVKIPEIELNSQFFIDQKAISARLDQGVKDAGGYQELLNAHEKSTNDVLEASQRSTNILDIINHSVGFFLSESRLNEIAKRQIALGDSRSGHAAQLSGFARAMSDLTQELKEADDRVAFLRNSIDNAGPIYAELTSHRARIDLIAQQIAEKEVSVRLDTAKLDGLQANLKQVSGFKLTANFILSAVEGTKYLGQENIERLTKCFTELESIDLHDKTVHATQAALANQMGVHERLISTGLDYLSAWPSNICPLCSAPHEDADKLRLKVKSQTLLSRLSQENAELLAQSETRRKQLLDEVKSITRVAEEAHGQQLADLRGTIKELSARLELIEREKSDLEVEKRALEDRVNTLDKTVWSLALDELLTRAQGEIAQLSLKRSGLVNRQTELSEEIAQLNRKVSQIDADLQVLTTEADTLKSQASYLLVSQYLVNNGINSAQLAEYCQAEKSKFESQLANAKAATDKLTIQCSALQQKMVSDGTWVSFAQLRSQKDGLDLELARAQSAINAFYESLAALMVVRLEDSLDQVKALISSELQTRRLRIEQLETAENSFKLLLELMASFKPYIKRLSLQDELAELEVQLDQRSQVDILLSSERSAVIEQLKTMINNFFYEDLINIIYKKIDPHPSFKKVEFKPDFDSDKPGLNIVVSDEDGILISPILYFSAAQSNILSLSVFLAGALHAKDDQGNSIDVVMIDDPIQSMDSINILSTIDLLRSICLQFDKQIIISTHDENFFGLLQRKIPAEILGAKFLQLEKFGVVVPVEPFLN